MARPPRDRIELSESELRRELERRARAEKLPFVEPLLRTTCTHEIDAARPIGDVVARLVEIGEHDIT